MGCLNPASVAYQQCDLPRITHLFKPYLNWANHHHHHLTDLAGLSGNLQRMVCMQCFGEAARQIVLLVT